MLKMDIRKHMLLQRRGLSFFEMSESNERLCKPLINNDFVVSASIIVAYRSFENEVSVDTVIAWALSHGKRVAIPCFRDGTYCLAYITSLESCIVGKFGILEPASDAVLLTDDERRSADVWLVPGVAFTQDGHRLGYGKGVYDRLLADVRGYKIGVCYAFQVVDSLPFEPHDVAMDMVITG